MKKYLIIFMALFSFHALAITPQEAYSEVQSGEAVLIDVREKDEIQQGMIKDAIWFPLSKINHDQNWQKDFQAIVQGKKIFLYCRSGNRSGKVLEILKKENIPSVNLGGYETLKHELPVKR